MPDFNEYRNLLEQVKELGRIGNWADGGYTNQCSHCKRYFIGDKRAMACLPCAIKYLVTEREAKLHLALLDINDIMENKIAIWKEFPKNQTTQAHIAGLEKIRERVAEHIEKLK